MRVAAMNISVAYVRRAPPGLEPGSGRTPGRRARFQSTGARGVHQPVAVLGPTGSPVAQLQRGAALSLEKLEIAARRAAAYTRALGYVLGAGGLRPLPEVAYDHLERGPIQSFGQHRRGRGADRRV